MTTAQQPAALVTQASGLLSCTDLFLLTADPVFRSVLHLYQHTQTAGISGGAVCPRHSQPHNGPSLETQLRITNEKSEN